MFAPVAWCRRPELEGLDVVCEVGLEVEAVLCYCCLGVRVVWWDGMGWDKPPSSSLTRVMKLASKHLLLNRRFSTEWLRRPRVISSDGFIVEITVSLYILMVKPSGEMNSVCGRVSWISLLTKTLHEVKMGLWVARESGLLTYV